MLPVSDSPTDQPRGDDTSEVHKLLIGRAALGVDAVH